MQLQVGGESQKVSLRQPFSQHLEETGRTMHRARGRMLSGGTGDRIAKALGDSKPGTANRHPGNWTPVGQGRDGEGGGRQGGGCLGRAFWAVGNV